MSPAQQRLGSLGWNWRSSTFSATASLPAVALQGRKPPAGPGHQPLTAHEALHPLAADVTASLPQFLVDAR